jgi:hypothetical protein
MMQADYYVKFLKKSVERRRVCVRVCAHLIVNWWEQRQNETDTKININSGEKLRGKKSQRKWEAVQQQKMGQQNRGEVLSTGKNVYVC